MTAETQLPPGRASLFNAAAFITIIAMTVDWSWSLWNAGAQWVWEGYQSALVSTSEVALLAVAVIGLLTSRGSVQGRETGSTGRRLTIIAGVGLVLFVALSAAGSAAPILSLARLADVGVGLLACLAMYRQRLLRDRLVVALLVLVVVQFPIVLAQQLSQSTFPLQSITKGALEIPASAPGAFVLQLPGDLRWQRSLGSFPHPNVLGGFAATAIVVTLPWLRGASGFRWTVMIVWALAWIELGLSFSRAGAIAVGIGCAIWGLTQVRRMGRMPPIIPLVGAFAALIAIALGSRALAGDTSLPASGPAVSERLLLANVARDMIWKHPLFGVGAGTFPLVESLPPYDGIMVDPVHVVPLLVAAEAGILAGVSWIVLVVGSPIAALLGRRNPSARVGYRLAVAVTVLALSSLDHYFWTLPPGRAIFWIALGAGVMND